MKDLYQPAEMEVISFDTTDIIATSDAAKPTPSWVSPDCPQEGPPGDTFL